MSVTLHHLPTVQACSSAKEALDALAGVFSAQMIARRLQLPKDFALLKIKPGETLLAYSGRAKKLQLEMVATRHPFDDNTVLIHFLNCLSGDHKTEKKLLTNHGTAMRWDEVMPMLYPVENERIDSNTAKEGTPVGTYTAQGGTSGRGIRPCLGKIFTAGWYAGRAGSRGTTSGSAPRGVATAREQGGGRPLPSWRPAGRRAESM